MSFLRLIILPIIVILLGATESSAAGRLAWPIGCIPGIDCLRNGVFHISYPDIDGDGKAFDCGPPGYIRHTGTDMTVTSIEDGVAVLAADDGTILWVSGGKFDHCPNENEPDCKPELRPVIPGLVNKDDCTDFGPACDNCCLSWGFNAGNFVLIKHDSDGDAAITFYAHLRKGSIVVGTGQRIKKGEKIAEVGSSGASLTPHLHFGVWNRSNGNFELADPWAGKCGPNYDNPLWQFNPPYRADVSIAKKGTGHGMVTSENGEVNCGGTCSTSLSAGTVVTLKAVPYSGSEFVGWEGACQGKYNICTLTSEGTVSVAAVFRDSSPPVIRGMSVPSISSGMTVTIGEFSAVDNIGITGYSLSETPTPPSVSSSSWQNERPSAFHCAAPGKISLYAWVKDAEGNISTGVKNTIVCGAVSAAKSVSFPDIPFSPLPVSLYDAIFSDGT